MRKNIILWIVAVLLPFSAMASTTLQGEGIQRYKKLSLDNHYTVYENNNFIFSELNIQRLYAEDINIVNLGLGYRTILTEGKAIGFNTFFDQGLSGNSPNGYGIGFEYLISGVYLNTNFYLKGRTKWEKPGNYQLNDAFDINVKYYIPQTPFMLNASYMRSQKEANLIYGTNERANEMYSVGLEIMPVSLLSVGYDYNRMHSGSNQDDNKVYAKLNIRFDKSFAEQITWSTNENNFTDFVRNLKVNRNVMLTVASEKDFPAYDNPEFIPDERPTVPDEKPVNKPEWELKNFGVEKIKHDIDVNGKKNYTLKDLAIADKGRKDYLQYLKNLNDRGEAGAPSLADIAKYMAINNI